MIRLDIKPLSVNKAFKGRRFKTDEYKRYETKLKRLLPDLKIDNTKDLSIDIVWGFSSMLSDVDNPTKLFVDVLQSKYKFNDRNVIQMNLRKEKVKKGEEFIKFKIDELCENT